MTKKRLALILARERIHLRKSEMARELGMSTQKYRRIELSYDTKVTVEEAYQIANFLGYEHPKELFISDMFRK